MTGKKYTLKQASKMLQTEYSDRIYGVKEAAERMGMSDSHIRRLLETGHIKGKKLGHDWVVLELKYKRKRKTKQGQYNQKS